MEALQVLWIITHTLICAFCFNFKIGNQGSRIATFDRFDGTCGMRNLPVIVSQQGMRCDGKKVWLNCTATVKEDILNDPTLIIQLQRCKNRENLDTCEHFYDMKKEKSCVLFNKQTPLWGPLFSAFQPDFKCPIKKAVYRARDGELDASAFLLFPQDSWVWKARVEIREAGTNRLLMCIIAEATIGTATKP